jgi:hypothetical protein
MVWAFGIGLGVANACLASNQFEGVRGAIPAMAGLSSAADGGTLEGGEHHTAAGEPDRNQGDPQTRSGKSNCESFCERANVPIPPQKPMIADVHGDVLLPAVVTSIAPVPVPAQFRFLAPRRDSARPLPLPITFLRLAL